MRLVQERRAGVLLRSRTCCFVNQR